MSKAADLNKDEFESANGSPEKRLGDKTEVQGDEGEESDDYEEIDDEEEEIAGDEEDEDKGQEGQQEEKLTHLLIGNPNGATAENEVEYEEDDGDDNEVDEGDDDDDDDDEYVEDGEEDYAAQPIPLNKKRSIDEVVDKEAASQGSKKIKA